MTDADLPALLDRLRPHPDFEPFEAELVGAFAVLRYRHPSGVWIVLRYAAGQVFHRDVLMPTPENAFAQRSAKEVQARVGRDWLAMAVKSLTNRSRS